MPPPCSHTLTRLYRAPTHTRPCVCLCILHDRVRYSLPHACSSLSCTHSHVSLALTCSYTRTRTPVCRRYTSVLSARSHTPTHACTPVCRRYTPVLSTCSSFLFLSHTHTLTPSGRFRVSILRMPSPPSYLAFTYTMIKH
jgi:hypothetical protein